MALHNLNASYALKGPDLHALVLVAAVHCSHSFVHGLVRAVLADGAGRRVEDLLNSLLNNGRDLAILLRLTHLHHHLSLPLLYIVELLDGAVSLQEYWRFDHNLLAVARFKRNHITPIFMHHLFVSLRGFSPVHRPSSFGSEATRFFVGGGSAENWWRPRLVSGVWWRYGVVGR